eukprot:gene12624-biopygen8599
MVAKWWSSSTWIVKGWWKGGKMVAELLQDGCRMVAELFDTHGRCLLDLAVDRGQRVGGFQVAVDDAVRVDEVEALMGSVGESSAQEIP